MSQDWTGRDRESSCEGQDSILIGHGFITGEDQGFMRAYKELNLFGGPNGVRTRVTDVRGRCPRPLDDGTHH